MTTDVMDVLDQINDLVQTLLDASTEVQPEDLGLDRRAAYRLWVLPNSQGIMVSKGADKSLQYYGGFEYVDKEYRVEMGDFVYYSGEDDRVMGHLERYEEEAV